MNALQVALTILLLNALTFGNGPVLVPLMEERFVNVAGMLSIDQLLYAYAIARVIPGRPMPTSPQLASF